MASCAICQLSPCKCCATGFTQLSGPMIDRTLVRALTGCVDQIRDIHTCLGARAYEVLLVRTRWTGGRRGQGVEEVLEESAILPTPLVSDFKSLITTQQPVGREDNGTITISEISPRFTGDQLLGLSNDGAPIPRDENFYYEVRAIRADGLAVRRRFMPNSVPDYNPTNFEWTIQLIKVFEDRSRQGEVRA